MIEELLSAYKSVIVLDGEVSKLLPQVREEVTMIAADGAGSRVDADYIVGDGDSLDSVLKKRLVYNPDQNTTDFEKCIAFAKEKQLLPALVIGMGGGEIDHVLGNAQVLLKHAENLSLFFLDAFSEGLKIGIPLEEGTWRTRVKPKTNVSLLPFGSCTVSTEGLAWELKDQVLTPEGLLAIRNYAKGEEIMFHLTAGKALVIIDL